MTDSQKWYEDNILRARETGKSRCCQAPIEDAGSCSDGCCDRWRCSQCKREWNVMRAADRAIRAYGRACVQAARADQEER